MQEWQLNSVVEVFVDASVERLWAALTVAADTEQYFMRSRVTVGDWGKSIASSEMTVGRSTALSWRRNLRIGCESPGE
jgi:uncharacterized protein YndB with AHSA1/START domain